MKSFFYIDKLFQYKSNKHKKILKFFILYKIYLEKLKYTKLKSYFTNYIFRYLNKN